MTDHPGENLLLIAARAPLPGQTKTRLGAAIGMERAAALYRAFLTDLAARFTPGAGPAPGYQLGWAFTPADSDFPAVISGLVGRATANRARYVAQVGEDWGERQTNLLRWGHEHGYRRTVLIASDSPHVRRAVVDAAFAALRHHDVVFGRVRDGGYYLIGVRGVHDVLAGVPMSTAGAADALRERSTALGLCVAELPATFDVDVAGDLDLLIAALLPDGAAAPATWATLGALGIGQTMPDEVQVV